MIVITDCITTNNCFQDLYELAKKIQVLYTLSVLKYQLAKIRLTFKLLEKLPLGTCYFTFPMYYLLSYRQSFHRQFMNNYCKHSPPKIHISLLSVK